MRALIIAAMLFVTVPACALEIGARLPIKYGEIFVVRNDDGIKNWINLFPVWLDVPIEMAIADVAGRQAHRRR